MSKTTQYLLLSLPSSVTPSGHKDDALEAIRTAVTPDYGTVSPFNIPEFKIGTLDALVSQADELSKLHGLCQGIVAKVGDGLSSILDGNEEKLAQQKMINDKPVDQYLRSFSWNKVKYRADKSIGELIDMLQKEATSIDNDVRSKYQQYNQAKSNLQTLQRKQTGNLSTKSLTAIVNPKLLVQDSEYLETHLVAVPNANVKEFLKTYETISPMVVPRSSALVDSDDEFTLYAVTTFKKHSPEFIHKAREHKWTPRDYKHKEGGKEEEKKEVERVGAEVDQFFGEALRMGRTGWSEGATVWIHALALRVFVESVLRYGLPLDFVCGLVKTTQKASKKARYGLDQNYSYLAGNAFNRDKKGKVVKDDSAMSQDLAAAGQGHDAEYAAYVCYDFELN